MMTGRFFLRSVKALVMVTLSDSFRIWPPSTTLWRDFQKAAICFCISPQSCEVYSYYRSKYFLKTGRDVLRASVLLIARIFNFESK